MMKNITKITKNRWVLSQHTKIRLAKLMVQPPSLGDDAENLNFDVS